MQIEYNSRTDLLYLRLDDERQTVVNRRVSDDVVLDVGPDERLVGIEIMDASRHLRLDRLLPVSYVQAPAETLPTMVREPPTEYAVKPKRRGRR